MPVRDGMALEDYRNALAFKVWGVPPPNKWVDDLAAQEAIDSFAGLI